MCIILALCLGCCVNWKNTVLQTLYCTILSDILHFNRSLVSPAAVAERALMNSLNPTIPSSLESSVLKMSKAKSLVSQMERTCEKLCRIPVKVKEQMISLGRTAIRVYNIQLRILQ